MLGSEDYAKEKEMNEEANTVIIVDITASCNILNKEYKLELTKQRVHIGDKRMKINPYYLWKLCNNRMRRTQNSIVNDNALRQILLSLTVRTCDIWKDGMFGSAEINP